MFIYIARHAWAGERGDPRWPDDSLRELTPDGIERFKKVVKTLADRGLEPARIATSPYTRCRQTAEIIAKHVVGKPTIDELKSLEPGSKLNPLVDWTNQQGGCDVCWVGHSPDVEDLAAALIGDGAACIRFAKGAIAAIAFPEKVVNGAGELYWLATAKLLDV
ncbi:MAG TPA: histidine phosphatase family protein [Lacipirellulaceae bacterium]|nr:histidine phosphatase family protein [Lacipirellulaceae bacterium]